MLENTVAITGISLCVGYHALLATKRKESLFRHDDLIVGGLLGLIVFSSLFGFSILRITNIGWTLDGDMAAHVLGLHFFRNEPWGVPIGAIRNYAYPYGTSVLAVEGYPFILLVKLFNDWFPEEPLQFHGIWILISCVLQGVAAMLLLRRISARMPEKTLATILFVLSPIMLFRAEAQHISLMSHFLILFALYLMLGQTITRKAMAAWATLFLLALWIHRYLLVMSWLLLVACLYRQVVIFKSCTIARAAILSGASLLPAVALFFALQPITPSSGYHTGFGYYALNLNAPINPFGGWSNLLLAHPWGTGHYEGFNYLGAGIILLICVMLIPQWKTISQREWLKGNYWLILLCISLTFYALSNAVTLGEMTLIRYPNIYGPLSQIFRASGRFFWPVWYLILLGVLALLMRQESRKAVLALLICATLVQAYDFSGKFTQYRSMYRTEGTWSTPLKSAAWNVLMEHYPRLSITTPGPFGVIIPFALLAASHRKQINIGFFSRYPQEMLPLSRKEHADLRIGKYRTDSMFIVSEEIAGALVARKQKRDLLARIDKFVVFAPGFLDFHSASENPDFENDDDFGIPLHAGTEVSFTTGASRIHTGFGWSSPEEWGTWSDGDEAFLNFYYRQKPQRDVRLRLTFNVFMAKSHDRQDLKISANGVEVAEWHIDAAVDRMPVTKELTIPVSLLQTPHLELKLSIGNPMSPAQLGLSSDDRRLGIGLIKMEIASP